ncbi:hypothetical protein IW15_17965 [Chryseobacterium soli]|uniref:Uncharacterized protein n=2 Tax=Chryseobacterium soli TaxID=445961 RepID=A0A086A2Y4_9FLAO|nr:hypothetical protein IW15_17965 [Chryseobacterium soli]
MFPFAVENKKKLQIPDLPSFENENVERFAALFFNLCKEYINAKNAGDEKTQMLLLPFFSKLTKKGITNKDINQNDKVKLESWFDEILN